MPVGSHTHVQPRRRRSSTNDPKAQDTDHEVREPGGLHPHRASQSVIGILLAIAIPRTWSFRQGPSAPPHRRTFALDSGCEAYYADYTATGYSGMTLTYLQASYDAGIKNIRVVRKTPLPTVSTDRWSGAVPEDGSHG